MSGTRIIARIGTTGEEWKCHDNKDDPANESIDAYMRSPYLGLQYSCPRSDLVQTSISKSTCCVQVRPGTSQAICDKMGEYVARCVTRTRRVHRTVFPSRSSVLPSKRWEFTVVGCAHEVQHQHVAHRPPPKRYVGAYPLPPFTTRPGSSTYLLAGHRYSAWVRRCCSTHQWRKQH